MLRLLRTTLDHLSRWPLVYKLTRRLLYILGLVALATPFALLAPPPARFAAAALIWLFGSAAAIGDDEAISGYAIICAAIPPIMLAGSLADFVAVAAGPRVSGIAVADAPLHPGARAFEFRDARVWTEYATTYRETIRDRKSGRITYMYYPVAPLAGEDWTPTTPVPAWVGCSDQYIIDSCDGWEEGYRSGVLADSVDAEDLRFAAQMAIDEHGLVEAPGAPVLLLTESIQAGQDGRAALVLGGTIGPYLLSVIPMLIGAAFEWLAGLIPRRKRVRER